MPIGGLLVIYLHQGQNGELRPREGLFASHLVVLITMLTFIVTMHEGSTMWQSLST